jgi:hypothetical protein
LASPGCTSRVNTHDCLAAALLQARTLAKAGFAASTFSSAPGPGAYGAEGAGLHDPEAAAQAAAEHATAVRMLEEWVDWVEMMRCAACAAVLGVCGLHAAGHGEEITCVCWHVLRPASPAVTSSHAGH